MYHIKLVDSTRCIIALLFVTPARRNMCAATNATASASAYAAFKTITVERPRDFVYHVQLNRPDKMNAISPRMWQEIQQAFDALSVDPECRAIVLSGRGKLFTAGLDLFSAMGLAQELAAEPDAARRGQILGHKIRAYQATVSSLERCAKPVLAAVHGGCVGAGVDLITAADMRYCAQDAWFCVKEVDIGMAADVGTLQRLPKVVGSQTLARELCFTGRRMAAAEALACGLVGGVFGSAEEVVAHAVGLAEQIAAKSPVAVQAIKHNMVYSLDRPTQEGLDQIVRAQRPIGREIVISQYCFSLSFVVRNEQAAASE